MTQRDARPLGAALAVLLAAVSVFSAVPEGRQGPVAQSGPERFVMRVVAEGFDGPWELLWGPDDRLWVTERRGRRVLRIDPKTGTRNEALFVPEAHQSVSQDGLLGLALHPDLLRGPGANFAYVAFTYDDAPGPAFVRRMALRRYRYDAATGRLGEPVDLLAGLPVHDDHIAGRLVFGPDRMLYLTLGDEGANFGANRCNANQAQRLPTGAEIAARDWTAYQGKVLRVAPDGTIPLDNPVIGGVRSHVFSYGHRNPQGLAFGPGGRLYESEHGPNTDDEINVIEAGGNYGWPHVAGYRDDKVYVYANWSASSPAPCASLSPAPGAPTPAAVPVQRETAWSHPDFREPLQTFFTVEPSFDMRQGATVAPGSLDIVTGGVPGWGTSLLMPSMLKGLVYRVALSADGRVAQGAPHEVFKTTNRYRDLAVGPDRRTFYVATDPDGRTTGPDGRPTRDLANPGAIIEFTLAP